MWINNVIDDTLKRPDPTQGGKLKWSRTSLTMFTAWVVVLFAFIVDTIKHQGEVDGTKFSLLVGVALGAKIGDAWSKKINPEIKTTDEPGKT